MKCQRCCCFLWAQCTEAFVNRQKTRSGIWHQMQPTVLPSEENSSELLLPPLHQHLKSCSWHQCDSFWSCQNSVQTVYCQPLHVNKETIWLFGSHKCHWNWQNQFLVLQLLLFHLLWLTLYFQTRSEITLFSFDCFEGTLTWQCNISFHLSPDARTSFLPQWWLQTVVMVTIPNNVDAIRGRQAHQDIWYKDRIPVLLKRFCLSRFQIVYQCSTINENSWYLWFSEFWVMNSLKTLQEIAFVTMILISRIRDWRRIYDWKRCLPFSSHLLILFVVSLCHLSKIEGGNDWFSCWKNLSRSPPADWYPTHTLVLKTQLVFAVLSFRSLCFG